MARGASLWHSTVTQFQNEKHPSREPARDGTIDDIAEDARLGDIH